MLRPSSLGRAIAVLILAATALPPAANAQTFTYTANGGVNFSNPLGWNFGNGPVPYSSAAGTIVGLNYGASTFTANNDLNLTLQTLQFSNFSNTAGLTFGSTVGGNYAFTGAAAVRLVGTGALTTLSAPVALGSAAAGLSFIGTALGNVTVSSVISSNTASAASVSISTGGLANAGIVTLSGANTFTTSAGVTLAGGSLALGNASALGVFSTNFNTLIVAGGTLANAAVILNPVLTAGANLVLADTAGSTGTFAGVVSGTGGVEVRVSGSAVVQTFAAINTYTGPTLIDTALPVRFE